LTLSVLGQGMNNLAGIYSSLGREQDARVMQEKSLEFWHCFHPENHSAIGATLCCGLTVVD
jgi:hypothetical protein